MQFQCSKCKQLIKADEQHYGKVIGCPKCGTNLKVPQAPSVTSQKQPTDPLIGNQIAHYKIEFLLGQGGMGKVYKAHNTRLDKPCAIKILPPEFARQDQTRIDRFIREARSAAKVEHPNVLPVQFVGKVEDNYFIEMSYVDGGTLDDILSKRQKLDANAAARIVRDVAIGLQAAHEQGIIHRDMKPSNVMLTKQGRVLVADFGLARMGETSSALTMEGKVVGTPLYMPPEQAEGKQPDPRNDIYSLGVMFYQMLTGNPPYTADSPIGIIWQHKESPVPDVTQLAPGTPPQIADLVRRMMAKVPEERPSSGYEVAKALSEFLGIPPPPPPGEVSIGQLAKVSEPERAVRARGKKKSLVPVLIGLIPTIIVVAVALYIIKGRSESGRQPVVETVVKKTYKYQGGEYTAEQLRAIGIDPETGKRMEGQEPEVRSQKPEEGKDVAPPQEPVKEQAEPVVVERQEAKPIVTEKREPKPEAVPQPEERPKEESSVVKRDVDLVAYHDDIKPVNDLIDEMKYNDAGLRANLLKSKYPDLIDRKLRNLEAVRSLRQRCIERVNSGAAKVSMGDISRRYAFAGAIKKADDTGLTAAIKKRWDSFDKEEVVSFYRKASDPTNPEDAIGIAAFLMEGNSPDFDGAMIVLGQAAKHGADVSPYLNHIETLKKSQTEYAEAEKRGKALETAEVRSREPGVRRTEEEPPQRAEIENYDGVYVTEAATGEKIPHPLSRKTEKMIVQGKRIDVPEGMVYVPAGPFLMGEGTEPPEGPQHEVYLDAYFIGKYEVTNAEYMEFVKATGHPMPEHWADGKIPEGKENHPVVYVSWGDAKAYCDWCGKRLPTEAEWEKASCWDLKSRRPREYPWGNDYAPRGANHCYQLGCQCNGDSKIHTPWWEKWSKSDEGKKIIALGGNTAPVGKFAGDVSFFGCFDMGGNGRDWVSDLYREDYYKAGPKKNPPGPTEAEATLKYGKPCRVGRGGYWHGSRLLLRTSTRSRYGSMTRYPNIGFRCAADCPWKPREQKSEVRSQEIEGKPEEGPSAISAVKSYDDIYVTTAATGEKIPHPLSRKTEKIIVQGKRIDVPEGMVFVPAGPFLMGKGTEPPAGPQHEVYLDAYFIGKYEVTNAEYMEFVKATGRPMPKHWKDNGGKIPEGRENHPVVYVSWEDAKAYCDWCGKRLPTEAEWEKAAGWDLQKRRPREYPWGDDYDPRRANHCYQLGCRCDADRNIHTAWWDKWSKSDEGKMIIALGGNTAPVGEFNGDRSFFGCFGMGGNVREWAADWYQADYYKVGPKKNPLGPREAEASLLDGKASRVVRGAYWVDYRTVLRTSSRFGYPPTYPHNSIGFRCAADCPWKPREQKSEVRSQEIEGRPEEGPSAPSARKSYDDVYVTTAATGEKIPHPLSRKTEKMIIQGKRIDVPEEMVYVPAGPFLMGDGTAPPNGPEHEVYLDAYFIGKYEVTNAEWKAFVDATGFTPPEHWAGGKIPEGKENHPVVYVSWEDAKAYCDWCGKRLPTEAEWEKSAGWDMKKHHNAYPWGDEFDPRRANDCYQLGCRCNGDTNIHRAWYGKWSENEEGKKIISLGGNTACVGEFKGDLSFFRCFDMGGNVREWVNDWYTEDYYRVSPKKNPPGPTEAEATLIDGKPRLVLRGGSWPSAGWGNCRTTKRGQGYSTARNDYCGFRVALSARR